MRFADGTRELERRVGQGDLVGKVGFSGPESVAHHEFPSRFNPPSWRGKMRLNYTTPGTGPRFLQEPLFLNYRTYLQDIADRLYEVEGAQRAMVDAVRDLKTAARRRVPREFGDLRQTATALVVDNGQQVYRRKGQ